MGMHHGYLVAETTADRLIEALGAYAGDFTAGAPAVRFEVISTSGRTTPAGTWPSASVTGMAYLLDTAFLLSDDLDLARRRCPGTSRHGGGCGSRDRQAGGYWFHVATDGVARRVHSNSYDAVSEPFDRGDPLHGGRRAARGPRR